MSGKKTILMAVGRSGGHIYPALAIAESLQKKKPGPRDMFCSFRIKFRQKNIIFYKLPGL